MAFAAPDPFREAIRSSVAITYTVDATLGGVTVPGAAGLAPIGGSIVDTTKPGVRRTLTLELAPAEGLFDALAPIGTLLTVTAHVRYSDRTVQAIPMGVFDVDAQSLTEGAGGLSLTAPDKWVRIQRARFLRPQSSVKGRKVTDEIAALIRGALGSSTEVTVTASSAATVPALTWETDRDQAILDLAESIGAWVYFDRFGVATVANIPSLGRGEWLVDASGSGVLISLDRERSRTSTRNVVVVESSAAEGRKFATQYVWDNNPESPTFAAHGSGVGPTPPVPTADSEFGLVPHFYDSPTLPDAAAAVATGRSLLARRIGLASQVSLSQVPNPAVDAFDVLSVLPPGERAFTTGVAGGFGTGAFGSMPFGGADPVQSSEIHYQPTGVVEQHIADTVTHPLVVGAPQQIEGRSVRSDVFDDDGGGGDLTAPSVPTGVTATAVSASQINVTWAASTDNVGVARYVVLRDGAPIATNVTGTSFSNVGLTASTRYTYAVQAADAAGNISAASLPASATTAGLDTTPPTVPTGLTATVMSSSRIDLTWTASTDNVGVTRYIVQRNGVVIASSVTGTSYSATGLTASTAYTFRVQAADAAGNVSAASTSVSATTRSTTPVTIIGGYNTNEGNSPLSERLAWWNNRAPTVRRYNSSWLSSGTFGITTAVAPEKRVVYSAKADNPRDHPGSPYTIEGLASGVGNSMLTDWCESIPPGWTVDFVWYHEPNDDIREGNFTGTQFRNVYAQFRSAIDAATLAAGTTVNLVSNFMAYRLADRPTYFSDAWVPPEADILTFDAYGNPGHFTSTSGSNTYGGPATGTGYGTTYPIPATRFADMFAAIERNGFAASWGILEFNTPRRSWDPEEFGRAKWLTDTIALFSKPPMTGQVPPKRLLIWEAPSGVNWDQEFKRQRSRDAVRPLIVNSP